jgi:hypothetical protein
MISYRSKKQVTVATLSTEGEYMAAAYTTKFSLWLNQILDELGHALNDSIHIYIDNTAFLNLTKDV